MEISKTYNPAEVEDKWYQYWIENKFFKSTPNEKEPYTIVIPPPNVTGVLHMGHMLNNTIQDILIRKARMSGKNACWVAGTDHASIATEAKVVAMLKEKGIEKKDLTREEFLKYAWEWKEKYGGIILKQLEKLGCSCDWDRTRFTMEEDMSEAVIEVFVRLYNKGLIYRGIRMVNWDPVGKTALSDEEVIHKESNSKLYFVKYKIIGTEDFITIATVRPETILGDTAVCVNPNDERYQHLIGKKIIVPIINREVSIIADEYVSIEFGTGALKITPAHDINDYEIGLKHGLEVIDTINDDGTMSDKCGVAKYIGKDRFAVRKEIAKELEELGQLVKVEDYKNQVGTSERTGAVIEPKLSVQWFLKMKELCAPALENVMNDNIKLHPPKFKNMYRSWMENVKDWCLSRQLWWGQRIPAYYLTNGEFVVAQTAEEALILAKQKTGNPNLTMQELRQDEDVLDTWASSWLWPISVFDGFKNPDNEDINYYYPTNDLVTAPEILFFWVARMIIAGYEFRGDKPFQNVYLTGIVRDKEGRKMSKQLGNSPDPIELMQKYSTDGVRVGMLFSSPAGNDLLFDEKLCEQGRNFANKIWNAYRLIKGWEVNEKENTLKEGTAAFVGIQWFEAKFNAALLEIEDHFSKYRMSDALLAVYKLFWDEFCDFYLEIIKPEYQQPIDKAIFEKTINIFEKLLNLMHPFMPFITEELWQDIKERKQGESICVASYPIANPERSNQGLIEEAETAFEIITQIRNLRSSKGLSPKISFDLSVKTDLKEEDTIFKNFAAIIKKLANIGAIDFTTLKVEKALSLVVRSYELYIPVSTEIDVEKEKDTLLKDLEYTKGFKESVLKKLSNEKFVNNAKPEIIESERKKLADAEAKIKVLEESLGNI